jgi:hypothetical protein
MQWMRLAKFGAVGLAVVLVIAAIGQLSGAIPRFDLFGTSETDRSQPAVLQSIRDLSRYQAVAGDYQVVVDVEKDVAYVPDVLAGQRTLFVAAGTVTAYVEFSGLGSDSITVSPDGKSVEVVLPRAQLDKPSLDNSRSYVFSQERGFWDRLNSLVETQNQQEFYLKAEEKIAEAAASSGLVERADENTRQMLTGLLTALGYEVTFTDVS